ncbi:PREDICTED: uncharacterized protein LOC108777067, partial [Cyphomyrmex costatus]|uniref:uncharacterized protein LOC108777067 n=1 Tax=Cyphomyrmex costatus TaxID=456900 RepID=UPI0008524313
MEIMLSDINTYEIINKDPVKKLTNDLRDILLRWKKSGYIDKFTYRRLLTTDGNIPRAYAPSFIKNSSDLINKLKNKKLDTNSVLVSLDVVSLFTNIPIDLASDSVIKRWDSISKKTDIPLNEFLIAFKLVLNSTFFIFNKKVYKQIFGTPMGSPLSPIVADMVMQDFEETAISLLPIHLNFYYRYVDDIILAAPSDKVDDILNVFNSLHTRLKFTMEIGNEGRISFLDTLIIVNEDSLILDAY